MMYVSKIIFSLSIILIIIRIKKMGKIDPLLFSVNFLSIIFQVILLSSLNNSRMINSPHGFVTSNPTILFYFNSTTLFLFNLIHYFIRPQFLPIILSFIFFII